jgi:hypothetical protein
MFIEVIKARVPYLGMKGTRREIPDNEARVHLALGNAKEVEKPKRRVYKRRDMQAESKPVVLEKPKRAYKRGDVQAEPITRGGKFEGVIVEPDPVEVFVPLVSPEKESGDE